MTANKGRGNKRELKRAKRGISRRIALAVASLCLLGALTGCTPADKGLEGYTPADKGLAGAVQEAVPGSVSQEYAGRDEGRDTVSDTGTGTLSLSPTLRDKIPVPPSQSYPTLRCINYNEKEFKASVEAAGLVREAGAKSATAADDAAEAAGLDANSADDATEAAGLGTNSADDATEAAGLGTNSGTDENRDSTGIAGGVTPHHLLAAELIAGFFRDLSLDPPETIIVIGPNHKRIGFGGLQTSLADWGTPFGRLEADQKIINKMIEDFNASENDGLMQEEHSISALVPYIRYYMPGVRIVPVLLHGNYSSDASIKLGKYLGKMAAVNPGKIALIASVDFSHYLDAKTAYKMDDITLAAIRKRDIASIGKMGNDNMDSPPSIITLLGAMEEIDAGGPEVSGHSNSFDIAGGGYDYTTSYFTMFFRYNDK